MGKSDGDLASSVSTLMSSSGTGNTHSSSPSPSNSLAMTSSESSSSAPSSPMKESIPEECRMISSELDGDPPSSKIDFNTANNSTDGSESESEAGTSSSSSSSHSPTNYPSVVICPGDGGIVRVTDSHDGPDPGRNGLVGSVSQGEDDKNFPNQSSDKHNVITGRQEAKKKGGFTLGLGKLNLRVFSRPSRSTERLEVVEGGNEVMNNQRTQLSVNTCSPAGGVSKSSSESNIPMCHNSLDNLACDLPGSRSTDSSCLLPCEVEKKMRNSVEDDTNMRGEPQEMLQQNEDQNGNSNSECSPCGSNSIGEIANNLASSGTSVPSCGQKFKLVTEGDVQVCKVKHGNNLMDKFIGSKLLRRWETHHIYLNDSCISSKTPIGALSVPVPYWQMQDVYVCVRLDSKSRYVIRIILPDGSLLLQGSNSYVRDQWYYSILWKKNIFKYHNLMRSSRRPEVILKELKSLVNFATTTPLQDDCVSHVPVEIVSNLLDSAGDLLCKNQAEEVLVALSPLLERSHPPPSLCRFFSRQCRTRPRYPLVSQLFTPIVRRQLKHNVDFGKHPYIRRFIQDFIQALSCNNDGVNVVRNFIRSMHGPAITCPHPRVMSNLVSVCLAAMFQIFERSTNKSNIAFPSDSIKDIPYDEQLLCYLAVLDTISEFEDWRPGLAQLLQPIPFPEQALQDPLFTRSLSSVIRRIGTDHRCDVHQMVLPVRDGKEGWFHLYSPSFSGCSDDGELWGLMLGRLLSCCYRRKRFLAQLGGKLLGSCLLLALREHEAAQEALCLLLEWQIPVQSDDQRVQIVTTIQSTPSGRANYLALCGRQLHLKELQQKGGPRKLTLPTRSTDKDLAKLLSCGSFGNLECLSLAFTQVTSACAEQLIKLPSLRYLNLWSTQFGDPGLLMISDHLPNLQVLNLCETPVTDKGLLSLTCMTSLRKLNLNSTHLSPQTLENLKKKLPALKEVDVRYTDAW